MHDEARGFVDDDEIVVLVQHVERDIFRFRFKRPWRRNLHADLVARAHFVAGLVLLAVDERVALINQLLQKRTGVGRQLCAQKLVEALPLLWPVYVVRRHSLSATSAIMAIAAERKCAMVKRSK